MIDSLYNIIPLFLGKKVAQSKFDIIFATDIPHKEFICGIDSKTTSSNTTVLPKNWGFNWGFLFALADVAFAAASNARNNLSLAIHADILYHQAGMPGTYTARAREIKDGRKIASYQVTIHTGDEALVASFTGTVYRKGKRVMEEDERI